MEPAGVRTRPRTRTCGCFRTSRTTARFDSHPRSSPPRRTAVEAAGYEAGEGFIKLPYDRELPTELLKALMQARVEDYETTGTD